MAIEHAHVTSFSKIGKVGWIFQHGIRMDIDLNIRLGIDGFFSLVILLSEMKLTLKSMELKRLMGL